MNSAVRFICRYMGITVIYLYAAVRGRQKYHGMLPIRRAAGLNNVASLSALHQALHIGKCNLRGRKLSDKLHIRIRRIFVSRRTVIAVRHFASE